MQRGLIGLTILGGFEHSVSSYGEEGLRPLDDRIAKKMARVPRFTLENFTDAIA